MLCGHSVMMVVVMAMPIFLLCGDECARIVVQALLQIGIAHRHQRSTFHLAEEEEEEKTEEADHRAQIIQSGDGVAQFEGFGFVVVASVVCLSVRVALCGMASR